MKIPWYYCVLTCVIAFAITYWFGVRKYDFTTPPELKEVKTSQVVKVEPESEPVVEVGEVQTDDLEEAGNAAEIEEMTPVETVEPSHYADYVELDGGAEQYVKLADALVAKGMEEHSIVAWERVLDRASPSPSHVKRAYNILKLHKVFNRDEVTSIAVELKLNASVPADLFDKMEQVLKRTAAIIEHSSGYLVSIKTEVQVLAVSVGKPRPTVNLWFSGKHESPHASFRTKSAKELGLDNKVQIQVFNIVGPFLSEHTSLTPIEDIPADLTPQETLQFLVTRYSWREFARLLYVDLAE